MIDYYKYKRIYTDGGMFTLSGVDFQGTAQLKDGVVYDFETESVLDTIATYNTDLFTSRFLKDRVVSDVSLSLPIDRSECSFGLGETLNYRSLKHKLDKIRENNTFVYSRLFIASNELPYSNIVSYASLTSLSADSFSITQVDRTEPSVDIESTAFFNSDNYRYLADVFDLTGQINYDDPSKFVLFCVTPSTFVSITSNGDSLDVVETSTNYETTSTNNLEFGEIGGITSNKSNVFISDKSNNTVLRYDIRSYLNNDRALQNQRFLVGDMGGEGRVDRRTNLLKPTKLACNDDYVTVYDSGNKCIKVYSAELDYVTTLTYINLREGRPNAESFGAMAFDPDFKNLYVLTSNSSNNIFLYRMDIHTRQFDRSLLEEVLEDGEVIQNISFSQSDSNYWYFTTSRGIYKKYKTRPESIGVGFYKEVDILGFNLNNLGTDVWNTQTTSWSAPSPPNFKWDYYLKVNRIRQSILNGFDVDDSINIWELQTSTWEDADYCWNILYSAECKANNISQRRFRGSVNLGGGINKQVIFTRSKIYFLDEPDWDAYKRVIKNKNYSNYGVNGLTLNRDEYIQVPVINAELYKLAYDLLLLKNNITGRFFGRYDVDGVVKLNDYNYNIDLSELNSYSEEAYSIHYNEENILGAVNRVVNQIYDMQLGIINLISVDIDTSGDTANSIYIQQPDKMVSAGEGLTLNKVVKGQSPHQVGSVITQIVTVTNDSYNTLNNISLTDSLDVAGAGFTVVYDPAGIYNGNASLAPQQFVTAVYEYLVSDIDASYGVLNSTSIVTGTYTDANIVKTDVNAIASIDINTSKVGESLVVSRVTTSKAPYYIGSVISYKVEILNNGSTNVSNITISDSLTAVTNIFDPAGMFSGNGNLSPGEKAIVRYDYTILNNENIVESAVKVSTPNSFHIYTLSDSVIKCRDGMDVVFVVDYHYDNRDLIESVQSNVDNIISNLDIQSDSNYRLSLITVDEHAGDIDNVYNNNTEYLSLTPSRRYVVDTGYKSADIEDVYYNITNWERLNELNDGESFKSQLLSLGTAVPYGNSRVTTPGDVALDEIINNEFAGLFRPDAVRMVVFVTDLNVGIAGNTTRSNIQRLLDVQAAAIDKKVKVVVVGTGVDEPICNQIEIRGVNYFGDSNVDEERQNPWRDIAVATGGYWKSTEDGLDVSVSIQETCGSESDYSDRQPVTKCS